VVDKHQSEAPTESDTCIAHHRNDMAVSVVVVVVVMVVVVVGGS
jgi:hypothetical protein